MADEHATGVPAASPNGPTHLVLLVNGLADTRHAWDRLARQLRASCSEAEYLIHASEVNERWRTHDGFDACGERLAEEVRAIMRSHPSLSKLSVVGHSMGGMIARWALGVLYDPAAGTVCGLAPRHFVTLATPHLGLTVDDGPAQVPFVAWAGHVPLLGSGLKRCLQSVGHRVAASVFSGTGRHFLALDGGPGELPLLVCMALDVPQRAQHFFSALRAFRSRAAYGNIARDHWVSWENATIRSTAQLPDIPAERVSEGKGVVREDPLEAGFRLIAPAAPAAVPEQAPFIAADADDVTLEAAVEATTEAPAQVVSLTLARLQRLPWRRMDVSFAAARLGTAHNNIQATRWTNLAGLGVLAHIAQHLKEAEEFAERVEASNAGEAAGDVQRRPPGIAWVG